MNPRELVEAEAEAAKRVRCLTCVWLATRPEEERLQWEELLATSDRVYASKHIHAAMLKLGARFGGQSLRMHRRGHPVA